MFLKYLFVTLGSLFLGLGVIGVFVPGLPTTPFLLLSAAFYVRSSRSMYRWLLNHKVFGKIIRDFRESRSISLKNKVISILSMVTMLTLSIFVFVDELYTRIIILIIGIVGFIVILSFPTTKTNNT
ncbi:MAG: YbaN family protein [Ignavibacteria bacterium]|nr:YbaN family protein [Ignavibacteria bacterium]